MLRALLAEHTGKPAEHFELTADELEVRLIEREGTATQGDRGLLVALETALDEELISEGLELLEERLVDGEVLIRPLPKLASRDMVTDAMLMAGEAAARFAEANAIPIPYVMQPTPDEVRQPSGMAEMYAYRRLFKPSRVTLEPEPHFGLGLDIYARATSPLRRYSDLVVHQQLRAHLRGEDQLTAEQVKTRVAEALARQARHIELSSDLNFQMEFAEAMIFPAAT